MRAPEFWSADAQGRDRAVVLRALLTPVSWAYGAIVEHRLRVTAPERVAVPVVCVGNLTLGGAGKTPIVRAVRKLLGDGAHVLLRGYGGSERGPLRVSADMDARDVGDEALLHAADGPTWVSHDRVAGAHFAVNAGARAIVMDDGFQNPSLAKDLSFVVIDGQTGFGNGQLFPAGPLRENPKTGLQRAHAVILMHQGARSEAEPIFTSPHFAGPILDARLAPSGTLPTGPLVAFAGIGRPERFFATLTAQGAELAEAVPYADHHFFTTSDLDWLALLARERNASLITTEKDHARLSADWRARIAMLPVVTRFDNETELQSLLAPVVARMSV